MNTERVRELAEALRNKGTKRNFDWADCEKCVAAWAVALFDGKSRRSLPSDLSRLLEIEREQAHQLYSAWEAKAGDLFAGANDYEHAAELLEAMADDEKKLEALERNTQEGAL